MASAPRKPAKHSARQIESPVPELLREIAKVTDAETALAVARAKGGQRAYIGPNPGEDHWLSRAVGLPAARKIATALCPAYGGLEFEIPTASQRRTFIADCVERQTLAGQSKNKIAAALGIHHRTVQAYRARLRALGRLPQWQSLPKMHLDFKPRKSVP